VITKHLEAIMLKRAPILLLTAFIGLHGTQSSAEDTKIVPLMSKPLGFEQKGGLAITVERAYARASGAINMW
jgi:hypothetical protein